MEFVNNIEDALGIIAKKNMIGMQKGDVEATWACIKLLKRLTPYVGKSILSKKALKFYELVYGLF